MVDRNRVGRVLIGQDDTGVSFCECSPIHVSLIHAATSLQVLKSMLVLWVVQEHLDLVVRFYVLQDDGMALFTSMVFME